jgi:signal transduction histidine kinase
MTDETLEETIFMMNLNSSDMSSQDSVLDSMLRGRKYFRAKIKTIYIQSSKRQVLQFHNISNSIFYDHQKDQNALLQLINACVSHELRNPLNSIVSQNELKKKLYEKIKSILDDYKKN